MKEKIKELIDGVRHLADGLLALEMLARSRDVTPAELKHFINMHLDHLEKLLKKHTKITSLRREKDAPCQNG